MKIWNETIRHHGTKGNRDKGLINQTLIFSSNIGLPD